MFCWNSITVNDRLNAHVRINAHARINAQGKTEDMLINAHAQINARAQGMMFKNNKRPWAFI